MKVYTKYDRCETSDRFCLTCKHYEVLETCNYRCSYDNHPISYGEGETDWCRHWKANKRTKEARILKDLSELGLEPNDL